MKSIISRSTIGFCLVLIVALITLSNCRKEVSDQRETCVEEQVKVDQAKLLLEHFEKRGDPVNCELSCYITAEELNQSIDKNIYILDLRMKKDYMKSHIKGAVHMPIEKIHFHFFEAIKPFKYDRIVLCCYSGQSASYATSILRMLGYDNVFALKWGMASWNEELSNKWTARVKQKLNIDQEDKANVLSEKHDFPKLSTEFVYREDVLKSRARSLLNIGFKSVRVKANDLFRIKDNQVIIAYCSMEDYNKSHVKGAIHFPIKQSLKRDAQLYLLPTDKEIIVYSRHGFESAYAVAYLRMLGYDAKTVLYGMNCFNSPLEDSFGPSDMHSYPLIKQEENHSHSAPVEEEGGC